MNGSVKTNSLRQKNYFVAVITESRNECFYTEHTHLMHLCTHNFLLLVLSECSIRLSRSPILVVIHHQDGLSGFLRNSKFVDLSQLYLTTAGKRIKTSEEVCTRKSCSKLRCQPLHLACSSALLVCNRVFMICLHLRLSLIHI